MAANTPVAQAIGGTASTGATALLNLLWALFNNSGTTYKCLSGQTFMLGDSGRFPEYDMWKRTVGYYPAMINYLPSFAQGATGNAWGQLVTAWNDTHSIDGNSLYESFVAHAMQGGVITWETISNGSPCAYANSYLTNHAAITCANINSAGMGAGAGSIKCTVAPAHFSASGGNGVILATDGGGGNHLHTFTYTGTSGNYVTGCTIAANASIGGALTDSVALNAFVAPYTPALTTTSLTVAAANGAFPLQYSSTAYQSLGGTVAGCSYNNGTTITTSGTFANMPVVPGMYVTGTGIPGGATVVSVTDATHFVLSATTTGGSQTGQTLTFTLGASTDYNAAQAFNSNANLNAQLDNIVTGLNLLGRLGIPVLFRPLSEYNTDFWWYSSQNTNPCQWSAQLFAYIVGYITGVHVFSGQPVSSTPANNVLFGYNMMAGLGGNSAGIWSYYAPYVNGTMYADVITCDSYNGPYNIIGTPVTQDALGYDIYNTLYNTSVASGWPPSGNSLPSYASNCPMGIGEFFGDANGMPYGGLMFLAPCIGVDLSTATTLASNTGYLGYGCAGGLYAGHNGATVAQINAGTYALTLSKTLLQCNLSSVGGSGYIQCSDGYHSFTWTGYTGSSLTGVVIAGTTSATVATNNVVCASGVVGMLTSNGWQQVSYNYYTLSGSAGNYTQTFNITSTAGVPSGSITLDPASSGGNYDLGCANQIVPIPSNTGNANCLAAIKGSPGVTFCNFWTWEAVGSAGAALAGASNQFMVSVSGSPTVLTAGTIQAWMSDPWMVNLEQIPAAAEALGCTLPWAKQRQADTNAPAGANGLAPLAALNAAVR